MVMFLLAFVISRSRGRLLPRIVDDYRRAHDWTIFTKSWLGSSVSAPSRHHRRLQAVRGLGVAAWRWMLAVVLLMRHGPAAELVDLLGINYRTGVWLTAARSYPTWRMADIVDYLADLRRRRTSRTTTLPRSPRAVRENAQCSAADRRASLPSSGSPASLPSSGTWVASRCQLPAGFLTRKMLSRKSLMTRAAPPVVVVDASAA